MSWSKTLGTSGRVIIPGWSPLLQQPINNRKKDKHKQSLICLHHKVSPPVWIPLLCRVVDSGSRALSGMCLSSESTPQRDYTGILTLPACTVYSLQPTRQAPRNMLRVLTRGNGGSSGLATALTPVRAPAYTLFTAKHKCRAAQTRLRLLQGFRSETLHVRHVVSTTSGSNSEELAGVRWS